jgi:hypothetical protein
MSQDRFSHKRYVIVRSVIADNFLGQVKKVYTYFMNDLQKKEM